MTAILDTRSSLVRVVISLEDSIESSKFVAVMDAVNELVQLSSDHHANLKSFNRRSSGAIKFLRVHYGSDADVLVSLINATPGVIAATGALASAIATSFALRRKLIAEAKHLDAQREQMMARVPASTEAQLEVQAVHTEEAWSSAMAEVEKGIRDSGAGQGHLVHMDRTSFKRLVVLADYDVEVVVEGNS